MKAPTHLGDFVKNKMIVHTSMLFLLTLISCGGGGTSKAKLEITNGFLASNAGFDGGLIITGKNTTNGSTFSVNLSTGVQSQMELPKGSWTFLAVGWDGGTVAPYKIFGGTPSCGRTDVNLSEDAQTVELNVTPARCGLDESFNSNEFKETAVPHTFRKIQRIFSCNTFIDHSSGILSTDFVSNKLYTKATPRAPLYCTTGNGMPKDLQTHVKSYKIHAVNKQVGQTATLGLSTPCLTGEAHEPSLVDYVGIDMRLPSKMPFVVQTFEDSSCLEKLASMPFESGLGGNYSDSFDSVFHTIGSPGNVLLLPGNDVRRAISPFTQLLPSFKCSTGACPVEPAVGTAKYYGYVGSGNQIYDSSTKVCPASAFTAAGATITSFICSVKDDGIEMTYDYTGPTGINTLTSGALSYNVYIKSSSNAFEEQKNFIHPRLIELIGYETSTFPRFFFNESHGDDEEGRENFGTLGRIREMMNAPAALIGISDPTLTFAQSCQGTSGTKVISLYDNDSLSFDTYRIEISAPIGSVAPNGYICQALAPGVSTATCPNIFEKEMRIFDYQFSSITPSIKIKINCNEKFGKFSSHDKKNESGSLREEKNLISWNTEAANFQRFESATIQSEYVINPATNVASLISENRNLTRMEKKSLNSYALWDMGFETQLKTGGLWEQEMYRGQYITNPATPNSISYNFYDVSDGTQSTHDYLLTTTASTPIMISRSAPPISGSSATSKFDLAASWAVQSDSGTGLTQVGVDTTNSTFNGVLDFKLDSLIILETGM